MRAPAKSDDTWGPSILPNSYAHCWSLCVWNWLFYCFACLFICWIAIELVSAYFTSQFIGPIVVLTQSIVWRIFPCSKFHFNHVSLQMVLLHCKHTYINKSACCDIKFDCKFACQRYHSTNIPFRFVQSQWFSMHLFLYSFLCFALVSFGHLTIALYSTLSSWRCQYNLNINFLWTWTLLFSKYKQI